MKVVCGYQWKEVIGHGGWGKIRRVVKTNEETGVEEEFAVKIMYRRTLSRKILNGVELLHKEYDMVRALSHPNIIRYHFLLDDPTGTLHDKPEKLYLFMDLWAAGDISHVCPMEHTECEVYVVSPEKATMLREKAKGPLLGLLEGLKYLHSLNIAHHDIKSDNILLRSDGQVCICDFGVAEKYDPAVGCTVFWGTPAYQSPEIVGNSSGDSFAGDKADIWAVGVVLYQLVCGGMLPFVGDSVYLLMKSIEQDPVIFPECTVDPLLDSLLRNLLQKDPNVRPSASECLEHPWFASPDTGTSSNPRQKEICTIS